MGFGCPKQECFTRFGYFERARSGFARALGPTPARFFALLWARPYYAYDVFRHLRWFERPFLLAFKTRVTFAI